MTNKVNIEFTQTQLEKALSDKEKLTTLFTLRDRKIKRLIVILNDIFLVTFSFIISGFIANELFVFDRYYILFLGISGILFFYRKIHDNVIKNIGLRYISNLIIGIVLSFSSYYLFIKFIIKDIIASEIIFNSGFIAFFFSSRFMVTVQTPESISIFINSESLFILKLLFFYRA